jgi:hypothetical protein
MSSIAALECAAMQNSTMEMVRTKQPLEDQLLCGTAVALVVARQAVTRAQIAQDSRQNASSPGITGLPSTPVKIPESIAMVTPRRTKSGARTCRSAALECVAQQPPPPQRLVAWRQAAVRRMGHARTAVTTLTGA